MMETTYKISITKNRNIFKKKNKERMKNKHKDQWLHQLMQQHRKGLDVDLKKNHKDFSLKVMSQLPKRQSVIGHLIGSQSFWDYLLCISLLMLMAIAWANTSTSSFLTEGTWFNSLFFRFKQIFNILLQLNCRNSINLDNGLLFLSAIPWTKLTVLVSVILSVILFEWKNPSYLKRGHY